MSLYAVDLCFEARDDEHARRRRDAISYLLEDWIAPVIDPEFGQARSDSAEEPRLLKRGRTLIEVLRDQ